MKRERRKKECGSCWRRMESFRINLSSCGEEIKKSVAKVNCLFGCAEDGDKVKKVKMEKLVVPCCLSVCLSVHLSFM